MAITLKQYGIPAGGYAANPFLAFASSNVLHNCLVITFWINTAGAVTVTDTQGNTWVSLGTRQVSNGGSSYSMAFVCTDCAAGANTVTVNAGGALGNITGLYEANMNTNTAENWSTNASSSSTDLTGSITPSGADSIVFAHAQCGTNTGCNIGTGGFSSPGAGNYGQGAYKILTSASATQCQFTGMSSANGLIIFDVKGTPLTPPSSNTQPVVFFMGF